MKARFAMAAMAVGALLLCGGRAATAAVRAGACSSDAHVQCAVYDRDQVFEIATRKGRAVLIQFEPGEAPEDNGVGIGGEPKAWAAAAGKNWMFLQPDMPGAADTNLVIVTNRRTYTFALVTASKAVPTTWVLRFDYPDTRAREAAQTRRKAEAAAAVGQADATHSQRLNDAYSMRGDVSLAPAEMWDDDVFTYFRYANGGSLPRVFRILADGSEAQPNQHMDGDTIVVHTVERGFNIRLGNAVLGIRNDAWSSARGRYNASGSTVPGMVRIMKDGSRDDGVQDREGGQP